MTGQEGCIGHGLVQHRGAAEAHQLLRRSEPGRRAGGKDRRVQAM